MVTTNPISSPIVPNAADGTVPDQPVGPTVTHYQQLASQFIAALDQIAAIIPRLEAAHPSTVDLVRSRQNIRIAFLATATSAVEQTPELQAVRQLDPTEARDTLQFLEAFKPVLDKVTAFAKTLSFTMQSRKASLATSSLRIYYFAKGIAKDPNSAQVASLVANMERDLGRRGRSKTPPASQAPAAPGIGIKRLTQAA
jgi:hypothetical protein